ncbi:DUF2231 domain-containing protein [Patulibacter sp.]|uniref:DUF2231 domain-containing protein n=1 Tax=Patulibacter sp. TaxID=1912859 RepID=UPI00272860F8|nr:DUF2231 domain-containing protein [Patulibacter sp.]MDO9407942.1 hypothetical protein [Patulibacter sp.]
MVLADLFNNVNGLPTHALMVHFTVVVATGATIGGLAFALVPRFRRWLSWPLLVTGVLSIVLGLVTPSTGEKLEARVDPSPLLEKHTELGDQMGTIMIAYGVILILAMVVVRFRRRAETVGADGSTAEAHAARSTVLDRIGGLRGESARAFPGQPQVAAALTLLVLAFSVISGIWIYRTGEAGARSVWDDVPATAPAGHGDEGR